MGSIDKTLKLGAAHKLWLTIQLGFNGICTIENVSKPLTKKIILAHNYFCSSFSRINSKWLYKKPDSLYDARYTWTGLDLWGSHLPCRFAVGGNQTYFGSINLWCRTNGGKKEKQTKKVLNRVGIRSRWVFDIWPLSKMSLFHEMPKTNFLTSHDIFTPNRVGLKKFELVLINQSQPLR